MTMQAFERFREYPDLTALWVVASIGMAVALVAASSSHSWHAAVQASVCLVPLTLFVFMQRRASSGVHPRLAAEWPRWHRFANMVILAVFSFSSSLRILWPHDSIDAFLEGAMAICANVLLVQAWREYRRLTSR